MSAYDALVFGAHPDDVELTADGVHEHYLVDA